MFFSEEELLNIVSLAFTATTANAGMMFFGQQAEYLAAPYDPQHDSPQSKPFAYKRAVSQNVTQPWTYTVSVGGTPRNLANVTRAVPTHAPTADLQRDLESDVLPVDLQFSHNHRRRDGTCVLRRPGLKAITDRLTLYSFICCRCKGYGSTTWWLPWKALPSGRNR